MDGGLDSGNGTYINGGTIIATGNMVDAVSSDSKQNFIYSSFNQIDADTLIVIKDQDDKVITAFQTGRTIKTLFYSSSDLDYKSYKIYTGGTINGEETNGLYTKVSSYKNGSEISFNDAGSSMRNNQTRSISDVLLIALLTEIATLVTFLIIIGILNKIKKKIN